MLMSVQLCSKLLVNNKDDEIDDILKLEDKKSEECRINKKE